jgi:lysophospholipase L1-like esterase
VLWIGDSIIYGTGNIPQTPYVQLSRLIGKGVQGAGVGGNTASQCASRWDTSLRHGPYTTVVWSCAINSIAGGATGAATATTVQAALAEAIADGQKVIVTGVMPWDGSAGWSSGKNAEGLDYNSRMSAWAVDAGATYVSTDSMGSGSPLTLLAGYDSGDAIHPNVAGAGALAALVQAASP